MNQYGQMAMSHWQTNAPARFAAIADPETFFTDLGEQAEAQTSGPDPSNEDYLAKAGRSGWGSRSNWPRSWGSL